MKQQIIAFSLVLTLLVTLTSCFLTNPDDNTEGNVDKVQIAVIYDNADDGWKDIYNYFDQSLMVNIEVNALDANERPDLAGYHLLIPQISVLSGSQADWIMSETVENVSEGAAVLLSNDFIDCADKDFIGYSDKVKIEAYPKDITFPHIGGDFTAIQEIVSDFDHLSSEFAESEYLQEQDYGYALNVSSAASIIDCEDGALYTLNKYGEGYVFFSNSILPNEFITQGFAMSEEGSEQGAFSNTTTSANQIFYNAIAEYVSKQQFGYAVSRVFGSYGSPSMAWEIHVEEMTGIDNDAWITFTELAMENGQIPSYSLIRNIFTWYERAEVLTYSLNEAARGEWAFSMDFYENAYSSGTHAAAGSEWIKIDTIPDAGGYFDDTEGYDKRVYPYLIDYDKDGFTDIICGSADGKLYWYKGTGFGDRLTTESATVLCDSNGKGISAYSAPVLYDINSDGYLDIITGNSDGDVYWFSGNGALTFEPEGFLINTPLQGQSFPVIGDYNQDGTDDLLIGSDEGVLLVCYGTESSGGLEFTASEDISQKCENLGSWLAPRFADLDGDGNSDIAIGVSAGYVAKLMRRGDTYEFSGYIETNEKNVDGNFNIKFGNNCVPFFCDITGNGNLDLIAGSLEYGTAYPIDSEYFPYTEKLQSQIEYLLDNNIYIGVHFYTNNYASAEREQYEIATQLKAFDEYGIDRDIIGANMHTWYTSSNSHTQTLDILYDAGILWTSGFAASNSHLTLPCSDPHCVISLPFFLKDGDNRTILVQNVSTLLNADEKYADISAKYQMPICIYDHCDRMYMSHEKLERTTARIRTVSEFQKKHNYNFVGEDQMMLATAAAYNLQLDCSMNGDEITLSPSFYSDDFELYSSDYQKACGVKITFAEGTDTSGIKANADVYYWSDDALYVSVNKETTISLNSATQEESTHLERVNIPALISKTDRGATLEFLDSGMMQIVVSGRAATSSDGWTVTEENGKTTFTKFGSCETVEIIFEK